jgi:hypothetical protein
MADAKISALPAATLPLAGTELVPIVQDGVTKRATAADLGGAVAWDDVTGKPATFPPEAHNQAIATVTGLQAALDGKAASSHGHAIGDVTGLQAALDGKAGVVTTGTATIDFGAFPGSNEASVSFADTGITATSKVWARFDADATSGSHTANDHRYAAALVALTALPTDGVGGVIHARSLEKMQGTFAVRWGWEE